jgi:hypothetical protein
MSIVDRQFVMDADRHQHAVGKAVEKLGNEKIRQWLKQQGRLIHGEARPVVQEVEVASRRKKRRNRPGY